MSFSNASEHACVGAPGTRTSVRSASDRSCFGEILPGIKMRGYSSNQLRGHTAANREPASPSCSL